MATNVDGTGETEVRGLRSLSQNLETATMSRLDWRKVYSQKELLKG